jgi:enoyl-CoA hydratase/carnithine racemase
MVAARPMESERPSGLPPSSRAEAGIRVQDRGPIRTLTLARWSKRNALTADMYRTLTGALVEAAESEHLRVVLIESAGGAFCVGTDLGAVLTGEATEAERDTLAAAADDFLGTLISFQKAVVAAVNGLAAGVGATMLLHCDMVIASRSAAVQFSFAHLLTPLDAASSVLLGERVGLQRATEWLLLGERIDAGTLLQHGMVNAIVPLEELEGVARARAEALAAVAPSAVRETKRLLRRR